MTEPEFWLGDCGDLIDSLWYLTLDRIVQDAVDGVCELVGVPSIRMPFEELFGPEYEFGHTVRPYTLDAYQAMR